MKNTILKNLFISKIKKVVQESFGKKNEIEKCKIEFYKDKTIITNESKTINRGRSEFADLFEKKLKSENKECKEIDLVELQINFQTKKIHYSIYFKNFNNEKKYSTGEI